MIGIVVLAIAALMAALAAAGCDGRVDRPATCTSIGTGLGQSIANFVLFALNAVGWPCLACYAVAEAVTRLRSRGRP